MRVPPQTALLPGGRLHLQHGPIDLVVDATAEPADRAAAFRAAVARFATVLDELCAELPALRAPADADLQGDVARRMAVAVQPHVASGFITPMAAVAGAVADEILAAMLAAAPLRRAWVNNGGDIALHLAPGEHTRIGMIDNPGQPALFGTTTIGSGDAVRGIATSGWRGRSFSLGIADAVTVLAGSAAAADAAATVIANAVDLPGHLEIRRVPACDVQPESDLGDRLVVRGVGALAPRETGRALAAGAAVAEALLARGLIAAAALHCQGVTRSVVHIPQQEALYA
jgi:ApbE superfamily uncharacterized protein (UPF0280 family)